MNETETETLRALIVDDERVNRQILLNVTNYLHMRAREAADGAAALQALAEEPADIVFLDLHMPVMDGVQVLEAIRAKPGRQPKVIVITADDRDTMRVRCLAIGVDGFMVKPVRVPDVVAAAMDALGADDQAA